MFGRAVLTHIRVRRTLVAIPIRTTILTLLGIQPVVVLADKHIVAHTLDVAVGASLDTLTVLAHAGLARGVTAVVTARPGMVGAVVFAVTAVVVSVVPARAVALVLTKLTIVAVSRLGVTVEAATHSYPGNRSYTNDRPRCGTGYPHKFCHRWSCCTCSTQRCNNRWYMGWCTTRRTYRCFGSVLLLCPSTHSCWPDRRCSTRWSNRTGNSVRSSKNCSGR